MKKSTVVIAFVMAALTMFSAVAEKKEYHQTTKYGEDYAYVETYDDDADRFTIIGEAMAKLKEEGYEIKYSTSEVRKHQLAAVFFEQQHTYAYTHKKGNKVLETHVYTLLSDATKNKVMQHYILARKVTKQ